MKCYSVNPKYLTTYYLILQLWIKTYVDRFIHLKVAFYMAICACKLFIDYSGHKVLFVFDKY